jgi:hypothetical protein
VSRPDPVVTQTAQRLSRIPVDAARAELAGFLAVPARYSRDGQLADFVRALDFNARLVTELRQLGVPIWGREPSPAEEGRE